MSDPSAPSIQSSGWPLAFRTPAEGPTSAALTSPGEVRVAVRALQGMQKEALVDCGSIDESWRLVSDEGPYLNGTDLAPFPLAFFTAGMQFSLLAELLAAAGNLPIESIAIGCDNRYSMNGSFLRGDARGGAIPATLAVAIAADAEAAAVAPVVRAAMASCPAQATMRQRLRNAFALRLSGIPVDLAPMPAATVAADPLPRFETLDAQPGADDIIVKTAAAATVHGVVGGAGSSLAPEQRRTLHVRGDIEWNGGAVAHSQVQLLAPIGSTFRFRCAVGASSTPTAAPPPLAYLAAGIGFCYMTQIGRYAHIAKQSIDAYRIVQRNAFEDSAANADEIVAAPVHTSVFLDAPIDASAATDIVSTGERTCFLHAAMRDSLPSELSVTLNGAPLAV